MPLKNTFTRLSNDSNRFSRRWGTTANYVEPYITGYHFVRWSYIPTDLAANVTHAGVSTMGGGIQQSEIKSTLESSTLSVTLPGGTVNKAEFNGLGNIRWAVPTNVDWDNTCTCRYLEASGLPIHGIMHGWVRMIRDYRAGVSTIDAEAGQYNKSTYAGTMYYWTTEPNGKYVEYHSCLTGMFPAKDPTDQFGHDITAYDKLEIDIDYNVDYLWHEDWTYTTCQGYADTYWANWGGLSASSTINTYGSANDGNEGAG